MRHLLFKTIIQFNTRGKFKKKWRLPIASAKKLHL